MSEIKPKKFAVLRFKKIKSIVSLRGAIAHNLRAQDTPNADLDKKKLNISSREVTSIESGLKRYENIIGHQKVRKNAVVAHEVVISGSSEHLAKMSESEIRSYFLESVKWLDRLHNGSKNRISWFVHNDEKTAHLHVLYAPLDAKNKLNSRSIIGGKKDRLSTLQTEFAQEVSVKFGLERGVIGSKAKHVTQREYSKKIEQELPKIDQLINDKQQDLVKLNAAFEKSRTELISKFNTMRADMAAQLKQQSSALEAETEKLENVKEQHHDLVVEVSRIALVLDDLKQNFKNYTETFFRSVKTYFEAAAVSPRLADFKRVETTYRGTHPNAQGAIQSVYDSAKDFDEKNIKPYRPKT